MDTVEPNSPPNLAELKPDLSTAPHSDWTVVADTA